ncbi:12929_t:CDS:2 [Dentiscutata erythropus]|uniref:12929_t:CDS:1 n=1 Tax=Dentiscutata erythropus TaxID=1348616 RepID=A0A9N9DVP4_9GLOM|nr:12929_t:CDS:2 [Dentiscutata erythropus]
MEANEENSRKRNTDLVEETENSSESEEYATNTETAQAVLSEDFDYDPSDVLNSFLEREKQNR